VRASLDSGRESLYLSLENVEVALAEARELYSAVFYQSPELMMNGGVEAEDVDGLSVRIKLTGRFWHRRRVVFGLVAEYVRHRIPEVCEILPVSDANLHDERRQAPDVNGDRFELERLGFEPDDRVVIQHRPGLTFTGYQI